MQEEMQAFVNFVQKDFAERRERNPEGAQNALIRVSPPQLIRMRGR